jgi:AcrR family transcriptional regulator
VTKPPPLLPRTRLPPDQRRAEFLRKAVELFSEQGFDVSTRELARKLGVTQPLLYRYFPSKDDLVREVYRIVYVERWKPEWDNLLSDRKLPLRERLQVFYTNYTDVIFTREWIRIYLFSGLKGVAINSWYVGMVEDRVLSRIIQEYRLDRGLAANAVPAPADLELAWLLHGGIFYYGVRKHIYGSKVMDDKPLVIANALDVFLTGLDGIRTKRTGGPAVAGPPFTAQSKVKATSRGLGRHSRRRSL